MSAVQEREVDPDEWGCEYCRNDGKLTSAGTCPKCDAQFFDEGETPPQADDAQTVEGGSHE